MIEVKVARAGGTAQPCTIRVEDREPVSAIECLEDGRSMAHLLAESLPVLTLVALRDALNARIQRREAEARPRGEQP